MRLLNIIDSFRTAILQWDIPKRKQNNNIYLYIIQFLGATEMSLTTPNTPRK